MQVETHGARRAPNIQTTLFFETLPETYERVFRELKPRSPLSGVRVEFRKFVGASAIVRFSEGVLLVRLSDILAEAPAPIAEALAHILLAKLFRRRTASFHREQYRHWLNRTDIRAKMHHVRRERGYKHRGTPVGSRFNLLELFEQLNARFFAGALVQPRLTWSLRESRTRLGHYDPSHNAIVLSRILDRAEAPALVVEYVMYHEMLHMVHPEYQENGKRRIHTREFRIAERAFPRYLEARKALTTFLLAIRQEKGSPK